MRSRATLSLLVLLSAAPVAAQDAGSRPLLGFSEERAAAQREIEARFDAELKAENLREWAKRLSSRPHHVGSPWGRDNAEFMAGLFRSWGWDARIEETWVVPARREPVPYFNFAPLRNAVDALSKSARAYDEAWSKAGSGQPLPADVRTKLDAILMKSERALMREGGLPGRPWYRHDIYAPGFYTGYGVKTLPSVREAIEQRRWKEVDAQVEAVAATIQTAAREIDRATAALQ